MFQCTYCNSPVEAGVQFCCQSCELLSNWIKSGASPLKLKPAISAKYEKFNDDGLGREFNFSKCPVFKKFRFYIEGLQCSSCVHLLEDFPSFCDSVIHSKLDFSKRTLTVSVKNEFKLGSLCDAIEQLGYSPTPLKEASDYEKARVLENKSDLKRIGVAAAIAGNAMLFSVPIYAGLEGTLNQVFKWISFFIFLPVLFYVAVPFYKKAWTSLLVRRINVDLMIVFALWAGFLFSAYALILGTDEVYFDSTSSFIFLILLTRYLFKFHQEKLLPKNIFTELFERDLFEVISFAENKNLVYHQISSGDTIVLKRGQLLPCDSYLVAKEADFDLSFLTGEAYPQKKHQGDLILSGSRLLNESSQMTVLKEARASQLAVALNKLDLDSSGKNQIQTLTDLVAHRLTVFVFSLAALFFIFTYKELGVVAFTRCLALITIACPCAVAFGTPLAYGLGLKRALREGFFVRSASVFERLTRIKRVVFDKTGTLTSSQLQLVKTFPPDVSAENKSLILGLEKNSLHPVASSLRNLWPNSEVQKFQQVTEISGAGIEAEYNGHHYKIIKSNADKNLNTIQVDFSINEKKTVYLYFEEKIHPEAAQAVDWFNATGIDVMMLSGDRRSRALEVSKKIGIRPAFVFAEQSADSKKKLIAQFNPCLFVGDGLNDIPGLNEAYVSFAIKGPFESTLQVSDIYAPQKNLNAIYEIFELAKKIQKTMQYNLLFAVLYNTVGGILALSGFINPLFAAVLMPLSSFLITMHTVWRLR